MSYFMLWVAATGWFLWLLTVAVSTFYMRAIRNRLRKHLDHYRAVSDAADMLQSMKQEVALMRLATTEAHAVMDAHGVAAPTSTELGDKLFLTWRIEQLLNERDIALQELDALREFAGDDDSEEVALEEAGA